MPFPAGDYTPYGYLRNPWHRAASWQAVEGGNLRTTGEDRLGVEWVYPTQRNPSARAGISLVTWVGDRVYRRRADFAALGLTSRYHSANILGFDWSAAEVALAARFFVADDQALCVRLELANRSVDAREVRLELLGCASSQDGSAQVQRVGEVVELCAGPAVHALVARQAGHIEPVLAENAAGWAVRLKVPPGEQRVLSAALGRAEDEPAVATQRARMALTDIEAIYQRRLADDDGFYATCPELAGDWPPSWRQGFVYDVETTRLLVMPAGGIFRDVWPAWMVTWPRVVLAEGTLDMLRLSYADPALAQRALLSLFRDAPMPNVPCVFQDGDYNMVAADGSRCGTSPAWCLPFLNLELVYLRSLDRAWLADIYPYLAAYIDWWLAQRTDRDGWLVYKCTWEAGEDGSPRLDPTGSGDADISRRVRPVELQATLAHAAGVLAFFAGELGRAVDRGRWLRLRASYARRTRRLFDVPTGRFRDWLIQAQRFQAPCPDQPYWGTDACRHAPLSLTPLLVFGQRSGLSEHEVWLHATAPWTAWPSWCYTLVECAAAAGLYAGVGEIAADVIDRVYRVTDRRSLAELPRPMPGIAPEFWPQDWRTFQGSDAYGWGATTANLLIRHLMGFKESRTTRGWVAVLTPALPGWLRQSGRRYTLRRVVYRGMTFDLSYTLTEAGLLEAELDLGEASRACQVRELGPGGRAVYASRRPAARHRFRLRTGVAYRLELH